MKEHNIDQLFRQKLHQHGVSPSPAAWEQVAQGLQQRRRKKGGYYMAAAAVALLLVGSWVGLQVYQTDLLLDTTSTAVATKQLNKPVQLPTQKLDIPQQEVASVATAEEETTTSETAVSINAVSTTGIVSASSLTEQSQRAQKHTAAPHKETDRTTVPATTPLPLPVEEVQTTTALAQALPEPSSVDATLELSEEALSASVAPVILASTEQVVIRYEVNNTLQAEEDSENTPEKVLSLLQKVKQGEVSLASIRQAKNNLLSGKFNKP